MFEIILFCAALFFAVSVCIHHYQLKKEINKSSEYIGDEIHKAAEHSIMASNTINPIISLVEVTRAVQIIESVHEKFGYNKSSKTANTDTEEMLRILREQKDKILQDVVDRNPEFMPVHPLSAEAGFAKHTLNETVQKSDISLADSGGS